MRRSLLAASAAVVGVVLLVGGGVTWAGWTDEATGGTAVITAGDLQVALAQSGPAAVQLAAAPPGVYPTAGSAGLIPGTQGQRWSYTVTNRGDSAVPATAVLRLRTASVANGYAVARPYLRARVTTSAGTQDLPNQAFGPQGLDHVVNVPGVLQPGASTSVTLTVSLPATAQGPDGRTVEVGMILHDWRSADLSSAPLFTMANAALLRQEPEN